MSYSRKDSLAAMATGDKRNVTVKRCAAMGDVLLCLPALKQLGKNAGNTPVELITIPKFKQLVDNIPYVTKTEHKDRGVYIDLDTVFQTGDKHMIDCYGERAGVFIKNRMIDIVLTESEKRAGKVILGEHHGKFIIGIHYRNIPQSASRDITDGQYSELIDKLLETENVIIVILGDNVLPVKFGERVIKTPRTSIREMMAVIDLCDLVICPNSGIMHIAGARGVPMVIYEGAFDVNNFAPIGGDYDVIYSRDKEECAPCKQTSCAKKVNSCMQNIKMVDIVDAVKRRMAPTEVEVSIIIAVHNQLPYTLKCMDRLLQNTRDVKYEVIIVDNASTEVVPKAWPDTTILVNKVNVGVSRAWNQGARRARGKYLCFLNNDTEVFPGWLSAMLDRIKSDDKIGIVGAKLVTKENTIQHAGIVLSGPDVTHVNAGMDEAKPEVNEPKEMAAVTGACILTPRKLFFEVGGIEDRYFAYYEDIDYCLTLRERGYKVFYEPKAKAIHHVAVTSFTMPGGPLAIGLESSKIYQTKWRLK